MTRARCAFLGLCLAAAPAGAQAPAVKGGPTTPPPQPADSVDGEDSAEDPPGPPEEGDELVVGHRIFETTVDARSTAEAMEATADAVSVVDTKEDRTRSSDMASVLRRETGVAVRQAGGLGSSTRFSLNGLYDDQIRFFIDGLPLDMAGYGFQLAQVPVSLSQRAEVYRGVVPIRLGADALGGAVNLVTRQRLYSTFAAGSLQVGSFSTMRATLQGRWSPPGQGFSAGLTAFHDATENDYLVDVEQADARGRLHPVTVPRFHDAYRATGVSADVAFLHQPWADELQIRGYVARMHKEIPHNIVMTVPYGEAAWGQEVFGASWRLRQRGGLWSGFALEVLGALARRTIRFRDDGEWVYDWRGRRIRERRVAGEISSPPSETIQVEDKLFARFVVAQRLTAHQTLSFSLSPTIVSRSGEERLDDPEQRDPLNAERFLGTTVFGVEHQLALFDEAFQHTLFGKGYAYLARAEEPLPGGLFRRRDRLRFDGGAGSGLRVAPFDLVAFKASYEYATRLPRPDEVFGDGVQTLANLDLLPERSHNLNLGWQLTTPSSWLGAVKAEANAFLRQADQLIVLLGNDRVFQYQNVYAARSAGLEASARYVSPAERVRVSVNGTLLDLRNASQRGTFGDFAGDRIPNRPWLFANAQATLRHPDLVLLDDEAALFWTSSYVHGFFRGWESQGLVQFKQRVPPQLVHGLGITYALARPFDISMTVEVQNLTDARAYDFFGVQRPGRAVFGKLVVER